MGWLLFSAKCGPTKWSKKPGKKQLIHGVIGAEKSAGHSENPGRDERGFN
jgi:hypothetical protein